MEFTYEEMNIPTQAEVHVYRMIQEIVQNAIRHSGADRLTISMASKKRRLSLPPAITERAFRQIPFPGHLRHGLKNILSRVDILQGEVYLASAPGNGTTYTIEIPIT